MSEPGPPPAASYPAAAFPGVGRPVGGAAGGAGGAGGRINAGAARRGRNGGAELGSTADSARARPLRALTPSLSHRHSRSAARWPSPTCSLPSSLPHSFSRSGCISMLTVTIFSRICLKSLVRVLPSPSLRSFPPLDPFFFFSLLPPALGLTFRLATETSTRKFIVCFDVNPQTLNFFISKTGGSRKWGESRAWGHCFSKFLWPRSAALSPE